MENIPGKTITDKFGNSIKLCEKCGVPVHMSGSVITCLNGCYLGEIYSRPDLKDEQPSEQNNFNPLITKMCPACKREGFLYFEDGDSWYKLKCEKCGGKGTYKEPMFTAGDEPVLLEVNDEGWSKCPKCGFRFKITDPKVWVGDRHNRCGQRLVTPDNWLLYWPDKS